MMVLLNYFLMISHPYFVDWILTLSDQNAIPKIGLDLYYDNVYLLHRDGKYKLIWGYEGFRDGWNSDAQSSDGATFSWETPWNMKLLGLNPAEDKETRDNTTLPGIRGTEVDNRRQFQLIALKRMYSTNITSGFVYLFDLEGGYILFPVIIRFSDFSRKNIRPVHAFNYVPYLYILADPKEEHNLAGMAEYEDIVLAMKLKIMNTIWLAYRNPPHLASADWTEEYLKKIGPDDQFGTGWCNNITINV